MLVKLKAQITIKNKTNYIKMYMFKLNDGGAT